MTVSYPPQDDMPNPERKVPKTKVYPPSTPEYDITSTDREFLAMLGIDAGTSPYQAVDRLSAAELRQFSLERRIDDRLRHLIHFSVSYERSHRRFTAEYLALLLGDCAFAPERSSATHEQLTSLIGETNRLLAYADRHTRTLSTNYLRVLHERVFPRPPMRYPEDDWAEC